MTNLDQIVADWDEGHREFAFALEGLPDDQVWVRPHPQLLSIGELAGHIAFWEAATTTAPSRISDMDIHDLPIKSPLVSRDFFYYTRQAEHPVKLDLSAEQLGKELLRVHNEAKAAVIRLNPERHDPIPGRPNSTWGWYLQYVVFHVAYHTGQAYSVRHLLGHTTTDN